MPQTSHASSPTPNEADPGFFTTIHLTSTLLAVRYSKRCRCPSLTSSIATFITPVSSSTVNVSGSDSTTCFVSSVFTVVRVITHSTRHTAVPAATLRQCLFLAFSLRSCAELSYASVIFVPWRKKSTASRTASPAAIQMGSIECLVVNIIMSPIHPYALSSYFTSHFSHLALFTHGTK